jgi:hypothetical protein
VSGVKSRLVRAKDSVVQSAANVSPVTNVTINSSRSGDNLTVEFAVDSDRIKFTADMDESGKSVVVHTPNIGLYSMTYELTRPLMSVDAYKNENSDYTIKLKLALKCRMTRVDTENGFKLVFAIQETDTEMVAMQAFGTWIRPYVAAGRLTGVRNAPSHTVLNFDGTPVYSIGTEGGVNYADVYNVRIPAGNVKYSGVVDTNILNGKSRLIFKGTPEICVQGTKMTVGRSCAGYVSLFGVSKEKKSNNEKFMFRITGRPEISVKTLKGVTGLGMKNVRLFGTGLVRFDGDAVFKTEVRQSGGLTWIVFVHDPAYKFRKFYSSGDVLNVVFYKG